MVDPVEQGMNIGPTVDVVANPHQVIRFPRLRAIGIVIGLGGGGVAAIALNHNTSTQDPNPVVVDAGWHGDTSMETDCDGTVSAHLINPNKSWNAGTAEMQITDTNNEQSVSKSDAPIGFDLPFTVHNAAGDLLHFTIDWAVKPADGPFDVTLAAPEIPEDCDTEETVPVTDGTLPPEETTPETDDTLPPEETVPAEPSTSSTVETDIPPIPSSTTIPDQQETIPLTK